MRPSTTCALAAAALLTLSAAAAARPAVPRAVQTDEGYGYDFKDDLLDGGVMDGHTAIIKTRHRTVRRTLIRPRTHFVPEMLKSVEHI